MIVLNRISVVGGRRADLERRCGPAPESRRRDAFVRRGSYDRLVFAASDLWYDSVMDRSDSAVRSRATFAHPGVDDAVIDIHG